jgi:hypothetical protein
MQDQTKPRCLKWGEEKARFRSKDKESRERCQAIGREVRIVHHREGQYHPEREEPLIGRWRGGRTNLVLVPHSGADELDEGQRP